MAAAAQTQTRAKGMSYNSARALAMVVGIVIIGVTVALLYARRVETVEVVAVLLFLPVFAALLKWDIVGGAIAGVLASLVYVAMRYPAIEQVGFGPFAGLVTSRAFGFIAFGVIGGWANKQLRSSLDKLDLYDQIDDETGLYNARFLLQTTDLEQARSQRYESVFAVSVVDIPTSWFDALPRRQRDKTLRELGQLLTASVRTVDRAAHVPTADANRIVVVLPETGPEGARTFTGKLVVQLDDWLRKHGVKGSGALASQTVPFPEDEAGLTALRESFAVIDEAQHPVNH
jgi:GGDEF domain-containing protein